MTQRSVSFYGLFNLLIVYFVWGSTYLAIRVGVRAGGGFPPFLMGATRLLAAAVILFLVGLLCRHNWQLEKKDLFILLVSGVLLWTGGNGLILWAEQDTPSGYVALFAALTPVFVAIFDSLVKRKAPSLWLISSLSVAFLGICFLTTPNLLESSMNTSFLNIVILISAPICWALGSILQEKMSNQVSTVVSSAYQQIFGALGFFFLAFIFREPVPHPSLAAWWAWGYLVVFGSLVGFTSFIIALKTLPTNLAVTYSYVNPVVAVILGCFVLHEPLNWWIALGSIFIFLGVGGIFTEKYSQKGNVINC